MLLKLPEMQGVGIKARRGLTYRAELFELLPDRVVLAVADATGAVSVNAGDPTRVPVAVAGLPANANIDRVTAELEVIDEASGAQETIVSVREGADLRTFEVGVGVGEGLQNAELKLDQGDVFWRQAGTLRPGKYAIPDFAEHANAYLDKVKPKSGKVTLQFVVKSDTAGKVRIEVKERDYSLLQTQAWKNELDGTFRVDRTLKLDFNQIEVLPLDAITPEAGRPLRRSTLRIDLGGQIGPERLLGDIETHDGAEFAVINPGIAVGQRIQLVKDVVTAIRSVGATGYFIADEDAELYLEVQPDAGGIPAGETPLASANFPVAPVEADQPQPWAFAQFEAPVDLRAGIPYWVVVKVVRGKVRLGLKAAATNVEEIGPIRAPILREGVAIQRSGYIWRDLVTRRWPSATGATPASQPIRIAALLSLVYLPESDNRTAAVQIGIQGTGIQERVDPGATTTTVSLDLTGSGMPEAVLRIHSHARGTLNIANVVQEYTLL